MAFDARDAGFRASAAGMLKPRTKVGTTYRYWNPGPTLDQGPTPRCVAFSWLTLLGAGPVTNRSDLPDAQTVYDAAQRADEWDGEAYDGTSVRAGAKVLQGLGYLTAYLWAYDTRTAADWVIQRGPVLFGTVWPDSMFDPDAAGFLKVDTSGTFDGQHANGHAYCAIGVSLTKRCPDGTKGAFVIQQTWGEWGVKRWGRTGIAYLPFSATDVLLPMGGEVCMATEVRVKA